MACSTAKGCWEGNLVSNRNLDLLIYSYFGWVAKSGLKNYLDGPLQIKLSKHYLGIHFL